MEGYADGSWLNHTDVQHFSLRSGPVGGEDPTRPTHSHGARRAHLAGSLLHSPNC